MLSQINFWLFRAGVVMDILLLLRILTLRLHRTYVFITLCCILSVFYDAVGLVLGPETLAFERVFILSKFLYAIVFPLAVWDIFEEAKAQVDKIRRIAIARTIASLVFITVFGLFISAISAGEDADEIGYLLRLGQIVWTGSVTATLAFLWVMGRGVKGQGWDLPANTHVWYRFFQFTLIIEAVGCFMFLLLPPLKAVAAQMVEAISDSSSFALQLLDIGVIAWCVWKLRAIPSDLSSAPEKASF